MTNKQSKEIRNQKLHEAFKSVPDIYTAREQAKHGYTGHNYDVDKIINEDTSSDDYEWGYDKEPDKMPTCNKCGTVAIPNNFYGFWCPTCNGYPEIV